MTREEAISRIEVHKTFHHLGESRAIYITEALDMAIEALKTAPEHGRWQYFHDGFPHVETTGRIRCTKCNAMFWRILGVNFKYCPNCGARMDKED